MEKEKWIHVDKCSDVKVGDKVRRALDPYSDSYMDVVILTITDKEILFDDGIVSTCKALLVDHYFIRK